MYSLIFEYKYNLKTGKKSQFHPTPLQKFSDNSLDWLNLPDQLWMERSEWIPSNKGISD